MDSRDNYDPRSLDPALSTDVPTGRAVGYLFDGLTRFTPDARVVPALATSWDVSPDGSVYTFHLRRGVTFTDGTPFVARQVAKSWQRVLDPKVRGGRGWPLYPILGAKEFADGKATVDPRPRGARTTPPSSSRSRSRSRSSPSCSPCRSPPSRPTTSPPTSASSRSAPGPWKLVEWKHDDYLLFAPNKGYWGGAPKADSLKARIIAEPSTAVAEFESGNVDVLQVPQGEIRDWEEDDRAQEAARVHAGARARVRRHQHDARPARRRARAAGDQPLARPPHDRRATSSPVAASSPPA